MEMLFKERTQKYFSPQTTGIYYVIASDGFCEITSYSFNYDITNLSLISSSGKLYPNQQMEFYFLKEMVVLKYMINWKRTYEG